MGDLGVFWVLEKVVNHMKCTALSKNSGKSPSKLTFVFSLTAGDVVQHKAQRREGFTSHLPN